MNLINTMQKSMTGWAMDLIKNTLILFMCRMHVSGPEIQSREIW